MKLSLQAISSLVALSLLLLPALKAQQPVEEQLRGRVTDAAGRPIPNITLVFEDEKGGRKKEYVKAESDGSFSKALPASSYRLVGTVPACFESATAAVHGTSGLALAFAWNPEGVAARMGSEIGGTASQISAFASLDYKDFSLGKFNLKIPKINIEFTKSYLAPGGISVETGKAHVQECNEWKKKVWNAQPGIEKP